MFKYEDDFGRNLYELKWNNRNQFIEYLYEYMKTKDASEQKKCKDRIERIIKQGRVANADIAYILGCHPSTVDRWIHKPSDMGNRATPAPVDVVPIIAEAFGVSADFLVGLDDYEKEAGDEQQKSRKEINRFYTSSPQEAFNCLISEILQYREVSPEDINVVTNNVGRLFLFPDFIVKFSHYLEKKKEITGITPMDKRLVKTKILNALNESPELLREKLDDILSDNQLSSNIINEIYIADLIQELKKIF